MAELVYEYRGDVLENIHRGRICVVDEEGVPLFAVGDCEAATFYRSSSKPLQTLPVLARGLHREYGLEEGELVIMAGSHAGEAAHLQAILSLLEKTGFQEEELIMRPAYPAAEKVRDAMLLAGLPPRKALHNCAGKHIAGMLLQRRLGGEAGGYWRPDSPAQKEIARCISLLSGCRLDEIKLGVDGCGVPVFAVRLRQIACSYAQLACPEGIADTALREAARALVPMIHRHPVMMRGTGYLCSVLNEDGNIVAKGGAQGVYGFGLKAERLGIALKIEDGSETAWPVIIGEILRQLGYRHTPTLEKLEGLASSVIINDCGQRVGRVKPVFRLERVG